VGETDESKYRIVADLEIEGLDRDFWHQWVHIDGYNLGWKLTHVLSGVAYLTC
jgi:hypothetical protein